MGVEGTASSWTLRFKHGKITILLYTDPLTPFATLKDELLDVLRERYPRGLPAAFIETGGFISIPDTTDDLEFGVLNNVNDPSKGWQELILDEDEKGIKGSPKAHGLKDGGVVAFRFRGEDDETVDDPGKFAVEFPVYDESYQQEEIMESIEQ